MSLVQGPHRGDPLALLRLFHPAWGVEAAVLQVRLAVVGRPRSAEGFNKETRVCWGPPQIHNIARDVAVVTSGDVSHTASQIPTLLPINLPFL